MRESNTSLGHLRYLGLLWFKQSEGLVGVVIPWGGESVDDDVWRELGRGPRFGPVDEVEVDVTLDGESLGPGAEEVRPD